MKLSVFNKILIMLSLTSAVSINAAVKDINPKVWVFCGLMGDESYQLNASAIVNSLETSLTKRFQVKNEDLTILSTYNEGKANCNRENFVKELNEIDNTIRSGREVMIFFYGHANKSHGDIFFNIEGKDLSFTEIAKKIDATATAPVITWVSTEFSGSFTKPLSGFNRITLSADEERDDSLDPDFMMSVAKAFESDKFEAEEVQTVSVFDLLIESRAQLKLFCDAMEVEPLEESAVDGDGDGIASRTPIKDDSYPIETIGFNITKKLIKQKQEDGGRNRLHLAQK